MAKYRGRDVKLNKPFRLKSGSAKKFGVYVKNNTTGNINKVSFGQPGMSIKRSNPTRRKSFNARMGAVLDKVQGQKSLSPAYWSMQAWKKNFKL
jgi:hypothetical protein